MKKSKKVLWGIYHVDPDSYLPNVCTLYPTKKIRRTYFVDTPYNERVAFIRWGKEYLRTDWSFSTDIIHDIKARTFSPLMAKLIVFLLNRFGERITVNK